MEKNCDKKMKWIKQIQFWLLVIVMLAGCQKDNNPVEKEDTTPPKVVSVSPEKNSEDVPVNVRIFAVFSENLSSKSNSNWFTLSVDNKECPGTVNVKEDTILFVSDALEYETEYTAHISADVTDEAENHLKETYSWSFTTAEEPDTTPPEVVGVSPENGEVDVSVNPEIEIEFNEWLDTASLYIVPTDGSTPSLEGIVDELEDEAGFFFDESLEYSTEYIAHLSATDLAGNEMEDYSWTFTTKKNPDTTPPEVVSVFPEPDEEGVAYDVSINTAIEVEFNEAIDTLYVYLRKSGEQDYIEGFIDEIGENYGVFVPNEPLEYSAGYVVYVSAIDISGNEMGAEDEYSWEFYTEENPNAPKVVSTYPKHRAENVSVNVEIRVEFNKEIASASIYGDATDGSGHGFGNVEWFGDDIEINGNIVTLTLNQSLEYSLEYRVSVEATDTDGNKLEWYSWLFTTEADENAPKVVSVYPEDKATNVPVDVEIRMEFDKPINSVDFDSYGGLMWDFSIDGDIEIDGNVAVLTLDHPLEYSLEYRAHIITAESVDGHKLKDYKWSFTTEEDPDK
jgi:large repetitive protein